eukprot:scaffold261707_cov55-Attheya_sp.AAC.1
MPTCGGGHDPLLPGVWHDAAAVAADESAVGCDRYLPVDAAAAAALLVAVAAALVVAAAGYCLAAADAAVDLGEHSGGIPHWMGPLQH